jgi:hypothetical protein
MPSTNWIVYSLLVKDGFFLETRHFNWLDTLDVDYGVCLGWPEKLSGRFLNDQD